MRGVVQTVIFLIVLATLASTIEPDRVKRCKNSKQCKNGCCLTKVQLRGKRGLDYNGGICGTFGEIGDDCLIATDGAIAPPIGTEWKCPCGDGLICDGSGQFTLPNIGEHGVCTEE
ncbi:unnamed protein product [Owenia fusiformis]|uniref:Uncharacterized protein n=1 Tax=Owenia fusiformis TaxID=6347 RepID=A0A8J1XXQ8_OWEFU|nr:unnamed protein product [Owenia fusiformis]